MVHYLEVEGETVPAEPLTTNVDFVSLLKMLHLSLLLSSPSHRFGLHPPSSLFSPPSSFSLSVVEHTFLASEHEYKSSLHFIYSEKHYAFRRLGRHTSLTD